MWVLFCTLVSNYYANGKLLCQYTFILCIKCLCFWESFLINNSTNKEESWRREREREKGEQVKAKSETVNDGKINREDHGSSPQTSLPVTSDCLIPY